MCYSQHWMAVIEAGKRNSAVETKQEGFERGKGAYRVHGRNRRHGEFLSFQPCDDAKESGETIGPRPVGDIFGLWSTIV